MIPVVEANFWAVFTTAIISVVLGALWYSPLMFGPAGAHLKGADKHSREKSGKTYVLVFIAAVIMNYVVAHVVAYATALTFVEGVQTGFWLWLGLVAPVLLAGTLWEGKPWELFLIKGAHYLVSLALVGGILAIW